MKNHTLWLAHTSGHTFLLGIGYNMGIYPISILKIPNFLGIYPTDTHTQILNILGILGMGIGYIPKKIGYFEYGYWVDTHIIPNTQYPIRKWVR
jgi:hypothetical protein